MDKPKITCMPNGPYRLTIESPPTDVQYLQREGGKPVSVKYAVSLCRCGGSKNKPFCDGTHGKIGFSDKRESDGSKNRCDTYAGKHITIHDNRAICAHAGHCTDGLKEVFRMKTEPWIDPDGAGVAEIIATIRKCPSGALSYSIDGVEAAAPGDAPMITATNDGPYAISGGVELAGVEFGAGAPKDHFTLCRCGASKNKPFCDGSHWAIGFKDPA